MNKKLNIASTFHVGNMLPIVSNTPIFQELQTKAFTRMAEEFDIISAINFVSCPSGTQSKIVVSNSMRKKIICIGADLPINLGRNHQTPPREMSHLM